jgi:hypothetical protein
MVSVAISNAKLHLILMPLLLKQRRNRSTPYRARPACRTHVVYCRRHDHKRLLHIQLEAPEEEVELASWR